MTLFLQARDNFADSKVKTGLPKPKPTLLGLSHLIDQDCKEERIGGKSKECPILPGEQTL
jgi:hypothetical protein